MSDPSIKIIINNWTLSNQTGANGEKWSIDEKLAAIKEAGFDAFSSGGREPELKELLEKHQLRFGGAFDAGSKEEMADKIQTVMAIDHGPINCQLADHDTPVEEAVELAIALMEEAAKQEAEVHLEMHRDTCTETPEKAYAIADGVKEATGQYPRMNFDFSHPAIVKHLRPQNYAGRLFENVPLFQQSTLWHIRPFNGHHCQIPITDGQGNFSPEYQDIRPFICQAFAHWLQGPKPNNELWVMPELGPKVGYGLSCFPDIWQDAIVLGNDLRILWNETLTSMQTATQS